MSKRMAKKLRKLVFMYHMEGGVVLALNFSFSVPKVTDDMHVVFDSNIIRINDSLWSPNFILKVMGSLLTMVGLETNMVDLDVG